MNALTIATYNIHKGMSALNKEVQIAQMAAALQMTAADILFLQEVQGYHGKRIDKFPDFPSQPHYQILSEKLNYYACYGKNAEYKQRHHGNAILSKIPIDLCNNLNISVNHWEQRGLLHCEVQPHDWSVPLVCLCAHLNLREPDRKKQYQAIYDYIHTQVNPDYPLILAGDFNDWRQRSDDGLGKALGLVDVFFDYKNAPKTFPARLPFLSLDRIYTRHLLVSSAQSLTGMPWQKLSDHLPLIATVKPKEKFIRKSGML
ncbi:endonuclease/exonuclease/phosphatase family protein [Neisseriaceae bacterium ESL0693]|nr:endonuclease/exonuclease/phosphatase family protein [Neisseriaceae bacterium ESL0693]